jgi:hypothetical protein
LNLDKCIFNIKKGKLLGCLVLARGIKANPKKIAAIMNMKPLASKKQVQKLTGRLAALNRFISRLAKKGLPFLELFKAHIISNGDMSSNKLLMNSKHT